MKKIIATMFVAAGAALISVSAAYSATPINATGTYTLGGSNYTYITSTPETGPNSDSNLKSNTGTAKFVADLYEGVYTNNTTGDLAFIYQVAEVSGTSNIEQLSGDDFSGFSPTLTNVSVPADDVFTGTEVDPSGMNANGGVPNFSFGAIAPGDVSDLLIVNTDASYYTDGDINAIDSRTLTVPTQNPTLNPLASAGFAPAATPEASSMLPFGFVGMGLLGLIAARRKQALKAGN